MGAHADGGSSRQPRLGVGVGGEGALAERALRGEHPELLSALGAVRVGVVLAQPAILDREHVTALDGDPVASCREVVRRAPRLAAGG